MLDVRALTERRFGGSVVVNILAMFAIMGNAVILTQYLQSVLGFSPLAAALWSLVPSVVVGAAAPVSAMRAPRLHHQALPDTLRFEANGLTPAVADSLKAMGWNVDGVRGSANVNAIMRVKAGWVAVTEPRDRGPSRAVGH